MNPGLDILVLVYKPALPARAVLEEQSITGKRSIRRLQEVHQAVSIQFRREIRRDFGAGELGERRKDIHIPGQRLLCTGL